MLESTLGQDSDLLRTIIDAVPAFLFVVDEDVAIHQHNRAASRLLAGEGGEVLRRRAGDVLHCLHSTDSPAGCGRGAFCRNCMIRGSVEKAFRGDETVRRRAKMELLSGDGVQEIYALVTVSPFEHAGNRLALLVIEDISQLVALQEIVPICASCKKVRDDDQFWTGVEDYFKRTWDLDFSHSFCPECGERELAALADLAP